MKLNLNALNLILRDVGFVEESHSSLLRFRILLLAFLCFSLRQILGCLCVLSFEWKVIIYNGFGKLKYHDRLDWWLLQQLCLYKFSEFE